VYYPALCLWASCFPRIYSGLLTFLLEARNCWQVSDPKDAFFVTHTAIHQPCARKY
jgi:hypothetical protein